MSDQPIPMKPPDPMELTGAVRCEQHSRWECSKRSQRRDDRCHAPAIRGLNRCRIHAGIRTALAKAQGEAITAWTALSGKATVNPADAVLGMLQMSWLRVHIYAALLEEQLAEAQADFDAGEEERRRGAGPVGAGAGLVGHTYASNMETIYASGEAVRALVALEAVERDRCVKYAKTAHDMGIAEREVRLAEQQGVMLVNVIRNVLGSLELTDQQQAAAAEAVPRELRAIAESLA